MVVVSGGGGKTVPSLTHADRGRFSVIVFERLETYLGLDSWNRQLLDKYCREYDVGVIAFAQPDELLFSAQVSATVFVCSLLCFICLNFSEHLFLMIDGRKKPDNNTRLRSSLARELGSTG